MRTNVAGFALALGMGLLVVLMGLLVLSAAGLTSFTPPLAGAVGQATPSADSTAIPTALPVMATQPGPVPTMDAPAVAAGDALFKYNCAQCHAVNEKVVGPALAGIDKRRPIGWVVKWVHNPAKVIASGDEYAVKLYQDNGQQQMPAFPQLSEKDIRNIVAWVSSQEGVSNVAVN